MRGGGVIVERGGVVCDVCRDDGVGVGVGVGDIEVCEGWMLDVARTVRI